MIENPRNFLRGADNMGRGAGPSWLAAVATGIFACATLPTVAAVRRSSDNRHYRAVPVAQFPDQSCLALIGDADGTGR